MLLDQVLTEVQTLSRLDKIRLIQILAQDLEHIEGDLSALPLAADECPDSPATLAAMRAESGGRSLTEIWDSLHAQ